MIKFGTDGWRAVIGEDFTFENVRVVVQAIADYLRRESQKRRRIVIGYDCRFLSDEFAREAACVFAANGIKVVLSASTVPTPAVSYSVLYRRCDLGIMITASHNPAKFNGIKIKTRDGGAADASITDEVEKLLTRHKVRAMSFDEACAKGLIVVEKITKEYTRFLRRFVALSKIRKLKLKLLIDTMYGAGNGFAQEILSSPSITIDYIHNEYNPSFGGIHPEPVKANVGELIRKMKEGGYDLGIVLDGDADRVAMVTSRGEFIDAQIILPLLLLHVAKNRGQKLGVGKTVVGSNLIDDIALSLGVPCYETPVGFKYISRLFGEKLIAIGGEEAGGIGFNDYIPERDGTASLLMVLEMIACQRKSFDRLLADLWKRYGRWYYTRISFPVRSLRKSLHSLKIPGNLLGRSIERVNTSDGLKIITAKSWLMFRKSGTEPIVRIYAEAQSRKELTALIELGKKLIKTL